MQRHVGIRTAGGRVADRPGGLGWLRRIGDHPLFDRCIVDAARSDRGAVGAPPVATEAPHLLCRDEIGAAPRDRVGFGTLGAGERPRRAVELADAQTRHADIRDASGGRVRSRIEHRPVHHQLAGLAGEQPAGEEPSGERKRDHGDGAVGRVRRDPSCAFPGAFAPGPFRGGQIGGGVVGLRRAALAGRRPAVRCPSRRRAPTARSPGRCRRRCAGTRHACRRARPRCCAARRG